MIAIARREVDIVHHHQQCFANRSDRRGEPVEQRELVRKIEVAGWLVEQIKLRLLREESGQGNAPALAA